MAFIKQFREDSARVADPMRPGKFAFEKRLYATNCHMVSHGGQHYQEAVEGDGWIEVPDEVADFLVKFRGPKGERFFLPHEVNQEVASGRVHEPPQIDAIPQSVQQKTAAKPPAK
ncbi:MAG: hypothetical protein KGL39_04390 [Patescibacteria group bacterium]|nr:hypothetical protein [Patescibacteria group bacterium]